MADVRCPMCGKANSKEVEICQYCGARIKPLLASAKVDSQPIRAGDRPVKKDTAEFEKVKPADEGPIHPGDAPTKKNTADLEKSLPTWLRSVRSKEAAPGRQSPEEDAPVEEMPLGPQPAKAKPPSGSLNDWLAGLEKAGKEEEQAAPDWLSNLRSSQAAGPAPSPEQEAEEASPSDQADWMARLGQELRGAAVDDPQQPPPGKTDRPAKVPVRGEDTQPEGALPSWLEAIKPEQSAQAGPTATLETNARSPEPVSPAKTAPGSEPESPEWLQTPPDLDSQGLGSAGDGNLPDWLSTLPSVPSGTSTSAPVETPDWLSQPTDGNVEVPAEGAEEAITPFPAPAGQPGPDSNEPIEFPSAGRLPDWLSNLGSENLSENSSMPAESIRELPEPGITPGTAPDWLSQLQADANTGIEADAAKDSFEEADLSKEERKETGPLPEWMAGIERPSERTRGTPALISEEKNAPGESGGPPAYSMETPDWLSRIKPDQGSEKGSDAASEQTQDNLEIAELPSWVQAMRPVESVVSEERSSGQDEQATEQSGPLAGLRGVLPATPGIGTVRKPPAYSVKLQVSEGQQRYAAYLERLIANESQPKAQATPQLKASRIWRWAISLILFLAVLFSLGTNVQAPPNSLPPSDGEATRRLIDAIPANAPVLAAFDYDPALSGELAAVAAPIFDQLLSKGIRLIVVSTSPTGPLLANQFLEDTNLVNIYQYSRKTDSQYINLGYLAGGSAGIQYFAVSPRDAMLVDATGSRIPPDQSVLQGVQWLSDFSAVIVLTDNADTGRGWVEQAGPYLGNTPMIMIASSQAEPMIRPYFDSGQIKGLVSGLVDAKAYEQIFTRPGLANYYWGSLSIGTLTAEVLIVLGAVGSLLAGFASRRAKPGKGA